MFKIFDIYKSIDKKNILIYYKKVKIFIKR